MKLTQTDKAMLLDMGHPESDFCQIEEATRRTLYEYDGMRINREEAISLLGRRSYLAGIARSAFHRTSVQLTPEEKPVYFDSSRLFEAGRRGGDLDCPLGGDTADDCADCPYAGDYHFVNGECVARPDVPQKGDAV